MTDRRPACCVCDRCPAAPGRDACARCAIRRAVSDGDMTDALALCDDAGIPRSFALALGRAEVERQGREEARRILAATARAA